MYIFAIYLKTKSMQCKWTESYVLVFVLALSPLSASDGSHSLWLFSTYIKGKTQFPKFSCTTFLDDITVGYYNSTTYIPRGNTTNEDDVIDSDHIKGISGYKYNSFLRISALLRQDRQNDNLEVYQTLVFCELLDLDKPGQMIIRDAARGSTTDELHYFNNKFTYKVILNITQNKLKPKLEKFKQEVENTFYSICITTLKNYLKKRENQINRKIKPRVRLIQKANSDSGGFRVSCLATGFYPRHINLTLFRDGQPVSDHEITGGDLLPNGDGTYQLRKSLEISAEKHKYTCSATHLSLDNKLDVTLEFDPGEPFKSVILPVLIVLALMLMIGTGVVIYKCWRR
ncbi:major histocompatibility complex class I-related gene protein-like isoform X26 [Ctenopharyngodon idella]|uniref:major histocompatibility complex class I-related gene protein-like isoform X26 n=1 Tax=Ctenopharyngodon idella TaxID=7959 RepID=UPI002230B1A3|nr:major histocompatibility complex class I-related gene protein-like isoform X26 [Ctenopharyngodon idella]XP_051741088.1 major histocompatibility complex class I-related gene protein-like isoform X26 [Ctenopharyngodon idella]